MTAPRLFDFHTARLARARGRAIDGDNFLERAAAEGLAHRLEAVTRDFRRGLVVGDRLPDALKPFAGEWAVRDFDEKEFLSADAPFDLAVSVYSLQAINDLLGALIQIRRALNPDGLFLGALFGGSTLSELRDSFMRAESEMCGGASPRVAPFADVRDGGALLQRAGFALPVADVEKLVVRYADLKTLVGDLRAHGQTNALAARQKRFVSRALLERLKSEYAGRHAQGGKLPATFETTYLTGWAPHQSQQQPLKPGSAKTRLSDALGTVERKV